METAEYDSALVRGSRLPLVMIKELLLLLPLLPIRTTSKALVRGSGHRNLALHLDTTNSNKQYMNIYISIYDSALYNMTHRQQPAVAGALLTVTFRYLSFLASWSIGWLLAGVHLPLPVRG